MRWLIWLKYCTRLPNDANATEHCATGGRIWSSNAGRMRRLELKTIWLIGFDVMIYTFVVVYIKSITY